MSALIVAFSIPSAFATAGTVENYYWYSDPYVCYNTTELNDIEIANIGTGQSADIKDEIEDTRAHYNSKLEGLNIDGEDTSCSLWDQNSIMHGSDNLGTWGYTAVTYTSTVSGQPTKIHSQLIDYTTARDFGIESNSCANNNKDIEWVSNHEYGHVVGLNHHNHFFYDHSVMESSCVSTWSAIQSVDDTAFDINY